ncbi:MAG: chorismate synthase [Actinomycetota bacterium]
MLRYLTAGESHGKSLAAIVDDYPSGIDIDSDFVNSELGRRQTGYGRGQRMSIESDNVEFISGISSGKSTGSPISFLIANRDWENWKDKIERPLLNPRPGHADLNGFIKYRLGTLRDAIERSSARETAARVGVGALAKTMLAILGINIYSYVISIGTVRLEKDVLVNKKTMGIVEKSELRVPDKKIEGAMKKLIDETGAQGDTIGGSFKITARGVPVGLGSYSQWDRRLDGSIASALMSIPAVKAVEVGNGFGCGELKGTGYHDEIFYDKKKGFYRGSNNCGGIEGGISNGQDIVAGAMMKPIPTTRKGLSTVNIKSKEKEVSLKERSDVCAVPSASIVAEAMLAIVLANAVQDKFGKDNIEEIMQNYSNWKKYYQSI